MIPSDTSLLHIQELFRKTQLSTDIFSLKTCGNGGNNRTYCAETKDGIFAVKKYFRGPADKRDRLESEFSFLLYAKQAAPHYVPTPYAQDAESGLALYEYINGRTLKTDELTENEIGQAIEFFCLLNQPELKEKALHLPLASEAGFSIQDHLTSIDVRIRELHQAIASENENTDARAFMEDLSQYWQSLLSGCEKSAAQHNMDIAAKLPLTQRCISPSDFGFHNALSTPEGMRFLDFEYAGWDDPARMANDFFSQLAVPVPHQYYDWFVREVMKPFPQAEMLVQRAKLLKAIYQVKWCCIAMNVFIPVNMARRQFANPHLNAIDVRKTQLAKAELLLKNLEVSHYGLY